MIKRLFLLTCVLTAVLYAESQSPINREYQELKTELTSYQYQLTDIPDSNSLNGLVATNATEDIVFIYYFKDSVCYQYLVIWDEAIMDFNTLAGLLSSYYPKEGSFWYDKETDSDISLYYEEKQLHLMTTKKNI